MPTKPAMNRLRRSASPLWGPATHSTDLIQVYEQATRNDPFIQEADHRRLAALEAKPQARARCFRRSVRRLDRDHRAGRQRHLPAGRGSTRRPARTRHRQFRPAPERRPVAVAGRPAPDRVPLGPVAAARPRRRAGRAGPRRSIAPPSRTSWSGSRSATSDVLAAAETLRSAEATLDAFAKQPARSRAALEVGVVTVIDVEEARSARDIATANVIAAKRALAVTGELLAELTGELYPSSRAPRATCRCRTPSSVASRPGWTRRWSRTSP